MPAKKGKMTGATEHEEEFMEHAKKDAMKAMELAKARFRDAEREIQQAINNDPVRATVIAAGLGAAIGAAVTFAIMKKRKQQ